MAVCISVQNTFKRRYMKMIETAYPKFRIRLDCALFCLLKTFCISFYFCSSEDILGVVFYIKSKILFRYKPMYWMFNRIPSPRRF